MISFVFEIPEMLRSSFKFYGFKEGSEEVAGNMKIMSYALMLYNRKHDNANQVMVV